MIDWKELTGRALAELAFVEAEWFLLHLRNTKKNRTLAQSCVQVMLRTATQNKLTKESAFEIAKRVVERIAPRVDGTLTLHHQEEDIRVMAELIAERLEKDDLFRAYLTADVADTEVP